jgi:hypothetical protein
MKYTTLKLFTSYLLILFLLLLSGMAKAQSPCGDKLCAVEFNASFNQQNSVDWLGDLTDCKIDRISIDANKTTQQQQKDYGIVIVPTIIIFNEGKEVKRFQANIMMQIEATKKEVQEVIDEILMDAF